MWLTPAGGAALDVLMASWPFETRDQAIDAALRHLAKLTTANAIQRIEL